MQEIEQFELEFQSAVKRYSSDRHATVNLPTKAAFLFEAAFEEWKTIKSPWDRKRTIFTALDGVFSDNLQLWQLVGRLIDDRFPEKALEVAIKQSTDNDLLTPEFWAMVSRANFILRNNEEAEQDAIKSISLDDTNRLGRLALADVFYWTGRCGEALEIYHQILSEQVPRDAKMEMQFSELVGFEGGLISSPVYALAWLKEDKNANVAAWAWAETEFYHSPHFRSQHAYWLIEQKMYAEGFIKLLYLSQEMPFFREAVVNAHNLIEQLGIEEQFAEEKARLGKLIVANNWSFS